MDDVNAQIAAYHDRMMEDVDAPEVRVVLCDACGTEGRIIRGFWGEEYDDGECTACEGTGGEIVEVQPIEMEDLQ